MKNTPVLEDDLQKVLKLLPKVDNMPADTVVIPFKDSLLGIKRDFAFGKRALIKEGKEEKYWVLLCFVASKGVV